MTNSQARTKIIKLNKKATGRNYGWRMEFEQSSSKTYPRPFYRVIYGHSDGTGKSWEEAFKRALEARIE